MKSTIALSTLLLLVAILIFSAGFLGGEGWFWAVGNGFGFVALAGLFYLFMDARNGAKLKTHQIFSYFVFGLIAIHCLWFLIGDPIAMEYLMPGAPLYMWSGVLSFLLLGVLVFSSGSSARKKEYSGPSSFRRWHKWIAAAVAVTSVYHIIGSGFYLNNYLQWILLSMIAIAALLISKRRWFRKANSLKLALVSLVSLAVFVLLRGFVQLAAN